MTPTLAAAFGLDLVWGAQQRAAAYYRGLYDALDGERCAPRDDARNVEYLRGYGDGLAQLATYRPVVTAGEQLATYSSAPRRAVAGGDHGRR